jgi:hypothetical protein
VVPEVKMMIRVASREERHARELGGDGGDEFGRNAGVDQHQPAFGQPDLVGDPLLRVGLPVHGDGNRADHRCGQAEGEVLDAVCAEPVGEAVPGAQAVPAQHVRALRGERPELTARKVAPVGGAALRESMVGKERAPRFGERGYVICQQSTAVAVSHCGPPDPNAARRCGGFAACLNSFPDGPIVGGLPQAGNMEPGLRNLGRPRC